MMVTWCGLMLAVAAASSSLMLVASASIESIYLDLVHRNLSDFPSLNTFYRNLLQEVRQHRIIDTVQSPINVSTIRSRNYDDGYLKNSCYESMSDLLAAHGYKNDGQLSVDDVRSLLPAILYSVENPGCARQSPPSQPYSFADVWIWGLILVVTIKLIHLVTFATMGEHCLSLTSAGMTETLLRPSEPVVNVRSPSLKYRLWLGLGFNAFTCGLMLGIIIYHLIPHIYDVPNENFDYIYLLRATVIFFGVYLFFIVEKLLRFRLRIDEVETPDEHTANNRVPMNDLAEASPSAKHACVLSNTVDNIDSDDDELDPPAIQDPLNPVIVGTTTIRHSHSDHNENPHRTRNLILYHLINDFSNDLIHGCGLATALAHDRLIGSVLYLMIFSEGFRRHSQTISQLGRKRGLALLLTSIVFLLLGYALGGLFIELNRRAVSNFVYIRAEYIYSIVYGALFYTALVTLIPELNDFGQHLQMTLKQSNQTSKQRRLIKTFILVCQNLFLIVGVLIALVLATIWRNYHRRFIYDYVCNRDSSRLFCYRQ